MKIMALFGQDRRNFSLIFPEFSMSTFRMVTRKIGPLGAFRERFLSQTPKKITSVPFSLNAPIFRMVMRKVLRENLSLIFPDFPERR